MARVKVSKKDKEHNTTISLGKVSQIPYENRDIFPSARRTYDLLQRLSCEPDIFKAIDIVIYETPDGKQAFNNYLRLANQGFDIKLFNVNTNRRIKRYESEMWNFCSKLGVNNSAGLDGLLDQLHGSSIAHGGMACEVVVNSAGNDVEDVLLIDPATFQEYEWLEDEHRYAIYQRRSDGQKVDLYEGNFFFVPHMPKPGRPDGTLQFLPAVPTMTLFYQLYFDGAHILNRVGFPRLNVTIDEEKILNSLPPNLKATREQQQKAYQDAFNDVCRNLSRLGKDSDLVHFKSSMIELMGGGVNGSGIDIRAWFEVLEPLIVNSFNMTPVMMGRLKSGSYSLGTVEFKIVTDTVNSMRRASKRMLESIINMWARVRGYPVYAEVTHKPIDWEVQKEKYEVELMKMEKARRAEEYCWIDHDMAAIEGISAEKGAINNTEGIFEYLDNDFRMATTDQSTVQQDNETKESAGGE